MIILSLLILLAASAVLLRARIQGILGLKWKVLVTSIHNDAWEVSTRWYDRKLGSWRGIVTSLDPSDGVISKLDNGKPFYHSKQPVQSLENMKKYHLRARNRFFRKAECQYLRDMFSSIRAAQWQQRMANQLTSVPTAKLRFHLRPLSSAKLRRLPRGFNMLTSKNAAKAAVKG